MTPQSQERMENLEREMEALRCELAQARRRATGRRVGWLGAPLLMAAWFAVSGHTGPIQGPAQQQAELLKRLTDLEGRYGVTDRDVDELRTRLPIVRRKIADLEGQVQGLADLESRVRKGPDGATQITAPFEVLDKARKTILLVTEGGARAPGRVARAVIGRGSGDNLMLHFFRASGEPVGWLGEGISGVGNLSLFGPTEASLVQIAGGTGSAGGVNITSDGKKVVTLAPGATGGNGTLELSSASGQKLFEAGAAEAGGGRLRLSSAAGKPIAELGPGARGNPALRILSPSGAPVAAIGVDPEGGGGAMKVTNAAGAVVAAVLGGQRGTVLVGNQAGQTIAEMSGSDEGRGMFQIFHGAISVAVLTKGAAGAGLLQLSNNGGSPTVEAGTLPSGLGIVRAGPQYKCTGSGGLAAPDCIKGRP